MQTLMKDAYLMIPIKSQSGSQLNCIVAAMVSSLRVKVTAPFRNHATKERPAHWENEQGTAFKNPWPSFRAHDWQDQYYVRPMHLVIFDMQGRDELF